MGTVFVLGGRIRLGQPHLTIAAATSAGPPVFAGLDLGLFLTLIIEFYPRTGDDTCGFKSKEIYSCNLFTSQDILTTPEPSLNSDSKEATKTQDCLCFLMI